MQTIMVHGTNGGIMVPFGEAGSFIQGRRISVEIIGVKHDPKIPLFVQEALVGLMFYAVLTREQVIEQCGCKFAEILPEGCLLAFAQDVIDVLNSANRWDAANVIRNIAPDNLDMYVLEAGTFRIIPE